MCLLKTLVSSDFLLLFLLVKVCSSAPSAQRDDIAPGSRVPMDGCLLRLNRRGLDLKHR